ncbi:MAG: DUF2142 domain-containing protein [Anaerolineae bacterium]|nr:DUF2142 domain-containing protein [Anaerolineae bacterium]
MRRAAAERQRLPAPTQRGLPWRGTALAAHLARLVSVILSTAAAYLTWRAARVAWPGRRALALGAAGVAAFWPQVVYIGSVVNNDSMALFAGALFLYFAVRLVAARPRAWDVVGMALALGLSALGKISGAALALPAALALIIWAARASRGNRRARRVALAALAVAVIVAVVALVAVRAWAFSAEPGQRYAGAVRTLYQMLENPDRFVNRLYWDRTPAVLTETFWTFIAAYGWQNVRASAWVYAVLGAWMLVAAAGVVASLLRARCRRASWLPIMLLLAIVLAVALASLFRSLQDTRFVAAGRYLLPAFPALATLGALGWAALPLRARPTLKVAAMLAPVLLIAAWAPFRFIGPTYAPPARLDAAGFAALADVAPADAHFENGMALLGYRVKRRLRSRPGAR